MILKPRRRELSGWRLWVALTGLFLMPILFIGGPWFYFNVIDAPAPAPLRLPAPPPARQTGPILPSLVSGAWTVSGGSQAGYRVDEILFGDHHTAVGRTPQVTGSMTISGTDVTEAAFTVDMASVKSDQGSRDVQFRGFIMRTFDHPTSSFHLTAPIHLGAIPADGSSITETVSGDLTLRGVTRPVTFPLSAELVGDRIEVNAEIPIKFGLWKIPNPSFAVAKLGDTGTIEVLLNFTRTQ